jgi:hypothetical protein
MNIRCATQWTAALLPIKMRAEIQPLHNYHFLFICTSLLLLILRGDASGRDHLPRHSMAEILGTSLRILDCGAGAQLLQPLLLQLKVHTWRA